MAKKATKNMVARKSAGPESGPVVLSERPCIKQIGELKASLDAAAAAGTSVAIDASQVETVDTATLQLLVAFENAMREGSTSVEWAKPSASFCGMADLCDLGRHLSLALAANEVGDAEANDDLCPVF